MKKNFTLLFLTVTLCVFATDVTFQVSMKGSGMDYDTVYIVGENTGWAFVAMTDIGDSVHSVTLNLTPDDSLAYYYITQASWTNYEDFRETVPAECDFSAELSGWDGDRALIVPETDTTISYIWGTCNEIPPPTEVNITFKVSMKGSGMDYDTVYIVGEQTNWNFVALTDEGDSVYSTSMILSVGDTFAYYYITQASWTNYEDYRETVPEECDYSAELSGWDGDRAFIVPAAVTTISYVWGTCDEIPEIIGIKNKDNLSQLLSLVPNPTQGKITIILRESNHATTIEIFDIAGRSHRCFKTTMSKVILDVSDIPQGIYLVKVSSGAHTSIQKLIIQ